MWYARGDFTEGSLFVLPDYTPQTLPFLIPVVSPAGVRLTLSAVDNGDGTGSLKVSGTFSATATPPFPGNADGQAASSSGQWVGIGGYNGSSWDRLRDDNVGSLRVSLYGKNAALADTALGVDGSGGIKAAAIGQGGLFQIPAGTTNGTQIVSLPTGCQGVRMYVPAGVTLVYTVATSVPGSAPSNTVTIANPVGAVTAIVDENLSGLANIYVTSPTGLTAGLVARVI